MACAKCCRPRNDLGKVLKCMPLAVFALIFGFVQAAYPIITIVSVHRAGRESDAASIVAYIFAGLQILVGIFIIASVLFKWLPGLRIIKSSKEPALHQQLFVLLSVGAFLLFSWVIYIAVEIIVFVCRYEGVGADTKWNPKPTDWSLLGLSLFVMLLCMICTWYLASSVASLVMVIECGGNGFEGLSYKQLKTGVQGKAFAEHLSDEGTISDDTDDPGLI
ncbi:putative transmembrane protein [Gregarina niphandrodes]|uniref:Transmembrane protein n=1 Tax=Gregarina niphandrodes TaxID=110365 RepID=A0A023B0U1_GRENI|nr:putative transmembrane protein [Gregarina niphandrodes]EZG44865.1 putative transmembrane protein [Gregarina niphandrodes]|eukprot:XP_011132633.1 putative transmembrane protein [Gregarina niphandrodes]